MENETKKIDDISAITVSSKVFAEIIGVSDRRVRQLGEEGILIRAAKGRYKLAESIKNYILTLKVANDSNNIIDKSEIDLETEKALKERVNRHIAELKLAKMKGEAHSSEDVERVMTDMLTSFKTHLLNIPSKLAPILVSRNDISFIKNILNKEVLSVLNEFKEYNPEDFYGKEYINLDEEEEECWL